MANRDGLDNRQFKVMKLWHGLGDDADKQWRNVMNRYPREKTMYDAMTPSRQRWMEKTYGANEADEWMSLMSGPPRLGV